MPARNRGAFETKYVYVYVHSRRGESQCMLIIMRAPITRLRGSVVRKRCHPPGFARFPSHRSCTRNYPHTNFKSDSALRQPEANGDVPHPLLGVNFHGGERKSCNERALAIKPNGTVESIPFFSPILPRSLDPLLRRSFLPGKCKTLPLGPLSTGATLNRARLW